MKEDMKSRIYLSLFIQNMHEQTCNKIDNDDEALCMSENYL